MNLKIILSRAALILFGLLLFGAIELTLRLAWDPTDSLEEQLLLSSIDPFTKQGDHYVTRDSFREAMRVSHFTVEKPTDTFRIFCLGGSATFGYPYRAENSWPAVMQRALENTAPDRKFEVINLGGTSYGTSRVLGLLRGIIKYEPDLVVVYSGNNEFVEDSYRTQMKSRDPGTRSLDKLYISRALRKLIPTSSTVGRPEIIPVESGGSSQFFFSPTVDGAVYQPSPEDENGVLQRYRRNLESMVQLLEKAGVPLILATVATNLADWSPEEYDNRTIPPKVKTHWAQLVEKANSLERDGRNSEALGAYREALDLYAGNAMTHYKVGRLLSGTGNLDSALKHFTAALDLDPAPVRAKSTMNAIIRNLSTKSKLPLADIEKMTLSNILDRLPENMMFVDNVHPTPKGNVIIARIMTGTLIDAGPLPFVKNLATDSFWQNEFNRSEQSHDMDATVAFTWGQIYLRKGELKKAEEFFRQAIQQGYKHPSVSYYLAACLARQQRPEEAYTHLATTLARHPDYREPLPLLARLAASTGRSDQAIRLYSEIIQGDNSTPEYYYSLALLLLQQQQVEQATSVVEQGLTFFFSDCSLNTLRGRVLEQRGQFQEAERIYQDVTGNDPACQNGWESLGLLQMNQQRFREAAQTFAIALQQPGAIPSHHLNLGLAYHYAGGQEQDALKQFRIVMQQQPDLDRYIPDSYRQQILAGRNNLN